MAANISTRNGGDGIGFESPATAIIANDNADRGIEAVADVTDGGGNRASGTATRPVHGVRCS